jgi:hypothetical protein
MAVERAFGLSVKRRCKQRPSSVPPRPTLTEAMRKSTNIWSLLEYQIPRSGHIYQLTVSDGSLINPYGRKGVQTGEGHTRVLI